MTSVWVGCGLEQQAVPLGQYSTRGHLDGGSGACGSGQGAVMLPVGWAE